MSYVVDVTDSPKWFSNAWRDAFYNSHPRTISRNGWNRIYPDCVWEGNGLYETVTFPDEQSYTWFVLRWS